MPERRPKSSELVGQTVDGYVILKEIGAGAASVVYQAMEPAQNNKLLALKVLDRAERALTGGRDADNPFDHEWALASRFKEPGILRVFGSGELADGRFYMAMEFVEGMTLAEELRHRHTVPWSEAVDTCLSVAWSVSHLHDGRIIHRDITPGNVMVRMGKDGRIQTKLIDFGSARLPGERDVDRPGPVGTPQYMAPEQVHGRGATFSTDVYALGALLYEMLAGKPVLAIARPTAEACEAYLREGRPVPAIPLMELAPDLPEPLAAFVQRALAVQPAERPKDAFAFGHELTDAADAAEHDAGRAPGPLGRITRGLGSLFRRRSD